MVLLLFIGRLWLGCEGLGDRDHSLNEVLIAALVCVHILVGADFIGGHRSDEVHVLVEFTASLGIAAKESVEREAEEEPIELVVAQEFAVELLLETDDVRHEAVLHELHSLMLDVIVSGSLEVSNHVRRDAVDGRYLGLLELTRGDELSVFRWDADALIGHAAFQQQGRVGVVQPRTLREQVALEPLIGFRLEGAWVLEHAGHVTTLIEESLAVLLCRGGELEVFAVDGEGALALVAIGGEAAQVDDIVARDEFSGLVDAVEELSVGREVRLHFPRVQEFQTLWSVELVAMDAGISVTPKRDAHHQVVQQGEAAGVGIGFGEEQGAGVAKGRLPAARCALVQMHGERSHGLGEYANAGPDCGDVQRTFRSDGGPACVVTGGGGEKRGVHRCLELGRGQIAQLAFFSKTYQRRYFRKEICHRFLHLAMANLILERPSRRKHSYREWRLILRFVLLKFLLELLITHFQSGINITMI